MIIMSLESLQPYLAAIGTIISVATLGFLLTLLKAYRDASQDHLAAKEERIKLATDEIARMKVWSDREKAELTKRMESTQAELQTLLKDQGLNPLDVALGKKLTDRSNEQLERVLFLVREIKEATTGTELDSKLELARRNALMATAVAESALTPRHLSSTSSTGLPTDWYPDWETNFFTATIFANMRGDRDVNINALVAYNAAISLVPDYVSTNTKARLITYRAAILKRLGRLDESESDLILSLKLATDRREIADANYNLACIYAIRGQGEMMYRHIEQVKSFREYLSAIAVHLVDYFREFRSDPRLLLLLEELND